MKRDVHYSRRLFYLQMELRPLCLGPEGGLESCLWEPLAAVVLRNCSEFKGRKKEADRNCRRLARNCPVAISSLLISQHQLELSICSSKVNCLHTYKGYVSHNPTSLQHAADCLCRVWKKFVFSADERVNVQFCHNTTCLIYTTCRGIFNSELERKYKWRN